MVVRHRADPDQISRYGFFSDEDLDRLRVLTIEWSPPLGPDFVPNELLVRALHAGLVERGVGWMGLFGDSAGRFRLTEMGARLLAQIN